ncbi:hypothetical protein H8A97_30485 [Bradyrhizobium sp. Arg62]|uniref:hypothetical protein n=1 Tax=Bradyrhizobium brasilense TaxID=1419277 RepID=UPI001E5B3800|nr:hypothetical protein [Bradyrhizobium brasilense]MCC8949314.1 hypothetical protein [Bradyrhizobium brasilense]
MTDRAERIREQHRAFIKAEPAAKSRERALQNSGLRLSYVDDMTVIVEGTYVFNLVASHWFKESDPSVHGYTAISLIHHLERSPKPAAGRDSSAAIEGVLPHTDDNQAPALAESAAGPIVPERTLAPDRTGPTASLLPEVWP